MILLTDRPQASQHLLSSLALANQCAVIGVHQALTVGRTASIVICDVALDSAAATDVLQSALASIRASDATGVIFLARDASNLTAVQAKALGAHIILPSSAPPAEILSAIRRMKYKARGSRPAATANVSKQLTDGLAQSGEALSKLFQSARNNKPVPMAEAERGGDAVIMAIRQSDIQGWLDVVWRFDDVTYQHCMLVAGLVAKFAIELGLSLTHQRLMSQAALLHDIGKAKIPHAILNKAGPLTPDEWVIMRTHAAGGSDLLARQGNVDPRIIDVVRHHHEYIDESGYPDKLEANKISQFVRITTICDVYAALIERRPYKPLNSSEKAISILQSMRGKLDEGLLAAFEAMISRAESVENGAAD